MRCWPDAMQNHERHPLSQRSPTRGIPPPRPEARLPLPLHILPRWETAAPSPGLWRAPPESRAPRGSPSPGYFVLARAFAPRAPLPRPLSSAAAATAGTLCAPVHAAHRRGAVHRGPLMWCRGAPQLNVLPCAPALSPARTGLARVRDSRVHGPGPAAATVRGLRRGASLVGPSLIRCVPLRWPPGWLLVPRRAPFVGSRLPPGARVCRAEV